MPAEEADQAEVRTNQRYDLAEKTKERGNEAHKRGDFAGAASNCDKVCWLDFVHALGACIKFLRCTRPPACARSPPRGHSPELLLLPDRRGVVVLDEALWRELFCECRG